MSRWYPNSMTNATPASPTSRVGSDVISGLKEYDWFETTGYLAGASGGTLDVYVQREIVGGVWEDWVHFPQLADGAAARVYWIPPYGCNNAATVTIGTGTSTSASVAMAAGVALGGHPGDKVRTVFVTGAGTTAASVNQTVRIVGHKSGGG
jgi:hypothetical protein